MVSFNVAATYLATVTMVSSWLNGVSAVKLNSHCTATVDYPICDAPDIRASQKRIRREIRSLSTDEWDKVVNAMWKMKEYTYEEGIATFGNNFRTYDYFVVKHAIAATDTRGDQAHFGAHFISWHSAFVLEFELAIMAIDNTIESLPYWDSTITSPSIFTNDYFGEDPTSEKRIFSPTRPTRNGRFVSLSPFHHFDCKK